MSSNGLIVLTKTTPIQRIIFDIGYTVGTPKPGDINENSVQDLARLLVVNYLNSSQTQGEPDELISVTPNLHVLKR